MSFILKDKLASAIPNPDSGKTAIFSDDTNLYIKAPDGTVTQISNSSSGTVTSVSVTTANGISGTVATATTTPAITLVLGAITPTSVAATGTLSGSNFSGSSSGNNSGDQTITLTGDVTGSGTGSFATTLATVSIAKGGTGQTTANAGLNALLPSQTANVGKFLSTDGTNTSWVLGNSGTVTSVDVSGGTTGLTTSGGPITTNGTITLSGTLAISNGGTGQTSANSALNAFLPSQTAFAGASLVTNGTNTSWEQRAHTGANSDITSLSGITGGISTADYIDFDTVNAQTPAVGRLTWDATYHTLQLGINNVNLQIGQEENQYVTNVSGGTLLNGRVVRVTGAQGSRMTVDYAMANSDTASATVLGILTETITDNHQGFVTTSGIIHDIDTSAFTEGQVLYLSGTTAGVITNVRPAAPNHAVIVGYCVRTHPTAGEIYAMVQNGTSLSELHDVTITSHTDGDILTYSSSSGIWINNSKSNTITALLPNQTGNSGRVLSTDGSGTLSWIASTSGTVTSVSGSGGTTGLTLTGGPITSSGTLTLGGTLTVANGGTGATTLTGYVKGTGTNALSASSTIPGADISGVVAPKVGLVTATTSSATVDFTGVDVVRLTLESSVTNLTITGALDGQKIILEIIQDIVGSRTVTWPSNVRFGSDITSITLSTAANKIDRVGFVYYGPASKYDVVSVARGY